MNDSAREAAQCDDLAATMGYAVIKLEQRRASKVALGLPDRRLVGKHALFFEYKFGRDRLSREQWGFLMRELDAGALASCGGLKELTELLAALQRPALTYARNLCTAQIAAFREKGLRGERAKVAA